MDLPLPVCLAASQLRLMDFSDLQHYDSIEYNVKVCRRGRVFVTRGSKTEVYVYEASPWANPFPVGTKEGQFSLKESLKRYDVHLRALLDDPQKRAEFLKLADKRHIGCFCALDVPCHRDIILRYLALLLEEERKKVDDN
mgnify:FL=1